MPPRLARSSVSQAFPSDTTSTRRNGKRKSRAQDAFVLASASDPDHVKFRQHRLGESELDAEEPRHKRQRMLDDGTDGDDDQPASSVRRTQQKNINKGERGPNGFHEEDMSSDSDGEGNRWRIGPGDEDDGDDSVDSDEAFGDSDEERFECYAFSGSKSMHQPRSNSTKRKLPGPGLHNDGPVNLNEDDGSQLDGDDSDDSLGSDAVDLATALDQYDEDDPREANVRQEKHRPARKSPFDDEWAGFSDSDVSDADLRRAASASGDEDEDDDEPSEVDEQQNGDEKPLKTLRDIAATFAQTKDHDEKPGLDDSAKGAVSTRPNAFMEYLRKAAAAKAASKDSAFEMPKFRPQDMPPPAPIIKRQRDRVERSAAYKKAKDTLDHWQDTVKQNRRAEHLTFPLVDTDEQHPQGENKILPATTSQPRNELEDAIESILQESGLANTRKKSEASDDGADGDDLPEQKRVSKRDERERLMELRKAREILFREEKRAKRVKKIKSKAYRRIHRRERDRNDRTEYEERRLLIADGVLSEDENERAKHDRRRAEERMGSRHRNSRWAKSVKATGRATWDEGTRGAMNGINVREQDIKARLPPEQDDSDVDEVDSEGEDAQFKLREKIDQMDKPDEEQPKSKLASMKFMQRAEDDRRKQNEEEIRRLRKELASEEPSSSSESEINVGRRVFGPQQAQTTSRQQPVQRNELEEPESDVETGIITGNGVPSEAAKNDAKVTPNRSAVFKSHEAGLGQHSKTSSQVPRITSTDAPAEDGGSKKDDSGRGASAQTPATASEAAPAIHTDSNTNGWSTVPCTEPLVSSTSPNHVGDEEPDTERALTLVRDPKSIDQTALIASAFGIDDSADQTFAAEKSRAEDFEDEQFETNALPGWGSWTGAGLSQRAQDRYNQHKAKLMRKTRSGVDKDRRKDRGKETVIVSEKQVRKNGRYLAKELPHPFETKEQYERSLRVPIGQEWNTKETVQKNVKPRVMVKQGIIQPMRKPLV